MSGNFVKIYGSILRSSVWQEPLPTKITWITMLALADADGLVEASIPGLAAAAGVSIEDCETALACFLAPDKYSGSKVEEGRRIRECRGGWIVINHRYYRELRTEKHAKDAARLAAKRARDMSPTNATVAQSERDCRTEAEAEADLRRDTSSSAPAAPSPDQPAPLEAPKTPKASVTADVARVFEHWRVTLGHPRAKLDAKRTKLIRARLTEFRADELCRAVDGCAKSDFHMGRHPKTQGQRHDAIELICRDAAHVEKFIELADGTGLLNGSASSGAEENWL